MRKAVTAPGRGAGSSVDIDFFFAPSQKSRICGLRVNISTR
jgi:hypothetical protein